MFLLLQPDQTIHLPEILADFALFGDAWNGDVTLFPIFDLEHHLFDIDPVGTQKELPAHIG